MTPPVLVLRHVAHEGAGTLAPALRRAGFRVRTVDIARGRPPLPAPEDVAGVVVLGGPMGVYETKKHPFLRREIAYLRRLLRAGRPVLGVCLGAQLMARALGARVYPNGRREIGWYPLTLRPAARRDPLFARFPRRSPVYQWHGDTFDWPKGAARLASSPLCSRQAFRWGERAWGLQFHVEVDAAAVRAWRSQPGAAAEIASLPSKERRDAGREHPARFRALQRAARPLYAGWIRAVKNALPKRNVKR